VALPIRAAKIPDAPINLSIDLDITTAYQIGLKWSESTNNGGSPVLDYQVEYKKDTDSTFEVFATGYTSTTITVKNLVPGLTYIF
jgi:hypothetical protein